MVTQRFIIVFAILHLSTYSVNALGQKSINSTFEPLIIVMEQAEAITLEPQITGGTKANPENWPSALYYEYLGKSCTASVIGPRVILTAAHCIPDGAAAQIKKSPNDEVAVECTHHPDYIDADKVADIALCKSNSPINLPGLKRFERVIENIEDVNVGSEITLLGFGCRRYGGGGSTGELFFGLAEVNRLSRGYLVTKGGAAVCFGDSGGGAFRVFSPLRRGIIGVNSRGDLLTRSFITPFSNSHIVKFLKDYVSQYSLKICGINLVGDSCVQ